MKNENSLLRAPFKLGSSYQQLVEENSMLRRLLNWKRGLYGVFFILLFYAFFQFQSPQEQIDEFPAEFIIEKGDLKFKRFLFVNFQLMRQNGNGDTIVVDRLGTTIHRMK